MSIHDTEEEHREDVDCLCDECLEELAHWRRANRPRKVTAMNLVVHRGGWTATKANLAAVPVPNSTSSYRPVPYSRLVEEVELHVPRFGLTVQSSAFALARDGNQMFGVLSCTNGHADGDYALAIGLRNSYDRSLAVGMASGVRVFVCDNLAFSGEIQMSRKHTAHVFRDLPDLIYRMLSNLTVLKARTDDEIAHMKVRELPQALAHHLMIQAVKGGVITASRLPLVIEAWEVPVHEEFRPRTAWSLFNAFTEVQKGSGPRAQMEESLRLSALLRQELSLN